MFSGVNSTAAIPSSSNLWLHEQSRVPSLGKGYVVLFPMTVLWTPPTSNSAHQDFVSLYLLVDDSLSSPNWISSTGLIIFRHMPPLLPRKVSPIASVIYVDEQRPSPYVHRVGTSNKLTRLHVGSLSLRPAALPIGNLRPLITQTPLPWATKVYGQLLGRDFNPQDN